MIGLAADMAISTISVIGTNALRTDITTNSLHDKYEYQQSIEKPFAHYKQIESLSILFHQNAKLREAIRLACVSTAI